MSRMSRSAVFVLAIFVSSSTAPADESPRQISGKELVEALRKGGHVIYFRHPATHQDQADTDTFNLDNVKKQRHLTDEGRKQAKAVGEAFRALKIPVSSVRTSKYFRAMETGKLLDLGEVESSMELTESQNVSPNEDKRRAAYLKKQLATEPPEGKNAVFVGHRPCLQSAVGKEVGDMGEGEAVIFKPDGKSFKIIARIKVAEWGEWAK